MTVLVFCSLPGNLKEVEVLLMQPDSLRKGPF